MKLWKFTPNLFRMEFSRKGLRSLKIYSKPKTNFAQPKNHFAQTLKIQLEKYFNRQRVNFSIPIDWTGIPNFTRKVLSAVKRIPYGEVWSYQMIAHRIGKPKSSRAIGQALARNPMPIVIPCHRVIRSNHSLGGFSLGKKWKKRLLELEGWKVVKGKLKGE